MQQPGACTSGPGLVCYANGAGASGTVGIPDAVNSERWTSPGGAVCMTSTFYFTNGGSTRHGYTIWSANGYTVRRDWFLSAVEQIACDNTTVWDWTSRAPAPDPFSCADVLVLARPSCTPSMSCKGD